MSKEKIVIPDNVFLEVIAGPDKEKIYCINKKSLIIGRDKIADFQLSDKYVSKRQCQIVFRIDHFTVIDLGSLNKTKVNNIVYVQKNLRHGDLIGVGKTTIKFIWENQDVSTLEEDEDILASIE